MIDIADLKKYPERSEIIIHYDNRYYKAQIKSETKGLCPKIILGIERRVYKKYHYE